MATPTLTYKEGMEHMDNDDKNSIHNNTYDHYPEITTQTLDTGTSTPTQLMGLDGKPRNTHPVPPR